MTTTQMSLNWLRKNGYVAAVTETWLTFPERKNGIPTGKTVRIKRDLWNCADIIAFNETGVYLVQTTTTAHQANRVSKIRGFERTKESPGIAVVARKWLKSPDRFIIVHGWMKSAKSKRWELTITNIERDTVLDVPDETELVEEPF